MKTFIISIIIILGLALGLYALPLQQKTTLTWEAPTTNVDGTPLTDLAGYKVYWATISGQYTDTQSKDVGNVLTINIQQTTGQLKGTYYFVVTAYDLALNESAFSNEVSATFKKQASKPNNLVIQ